MRIGAVFPQTEIGTDPIVIRDFAQAAEQLGYDYLLAFDHVLGANPASRPGWDGFYDHTAMFHEPLVLFGYLAGLTERIELVTGVIILPQRQMALIAKQAAEVDVLSGGRLRLGIAVGWNEVEYEAMGLDFRDRGRRIEEQIEVLRRPWTEELVTFEGKWHRITDAGINPLPVQRPIPLWIGGRADAVLRRAARLGDGWLPLADEHSSRIEVIRSYLREAGRAPESFAIGKAIVMADRTPEEWRAELSEWKRCGATRMHVETMDAGLSSPDAHIDAIRRFREAATGI